MNNGHIAFRPMPCPKCCEPCFADEIRRGRCDSCGVYFTTNTTSVGAGGEQSTHLFTFRARLFADGCRKVTSAAVELLRASGEPITLNAILSLIRSAPLSATASRYPKELNAHLVGLMSRACESMGRREYDDVSLVFLASLPDMTTLEREMYEAAIDGVMNALSTVIEAPKALESKPRPHWPFGFFHRGD